MCSHLFASCRNVFSKMETNESCDGCHSQAGFELVDHLPYSPDLAPSDFCLFPKLKEYLRGNRYEDDNEVMDVVESFLQE